MQNYSGNLGFPQYMPNMSLQNTPQAMMPNMPMQDQYTYPYNFTQALQLIRNAVSGETEDRLFYGYLIKEAPSEEDKQVISGIRDDEIKHFSLFRQVYYELTGQTLPPPEEVKFEQPLSYCDGLRKALMGEQGAVQRYRRILFALQNRRHINILTEIITDEIRHGILYSYLYSKNGCRA